MENGALKVYEGDYDYYQEHIKTENEAISKAECVAPKKSAGDLYREQKQLEAEKRKKENELKRTEEKIEETENLIAQLNEELNSPECATDYTRASEITDKINEAENLLITLMEKWEMLQI